MEFWKRFIIDCKQAFSKLPLCVKYLIILILGFIFMLSFTIIILIISHSLEYPFKVGCLQNFVCRLPDTPLRPWTTWISTTIPKWYGMLSSRVSLKLNRKMHPNHKLANHLPSALVRCGVVVLGLRNEDVFLVPCFLLCAWRGLRRAMAKSSSQLVDELQQYVQSVCHWDGWRISV